ncbi:MAG: S49 family peptidase, partial [Bacteroidia bacterium]
MKQFFGAFFGSILGLLITGLVCTLILGAIVSGAIKGAFNSDKEKTFTAKANSVLHLKIEGPIKERGVENPFEDFDLGPFMPSAATGINDICASIKKAKSDEKIKGVYLDIRNLTAGFATIEELRNALIDFKASGKFIYAYAETYSQREYYLASVATKLYMNPQGGMELKGLSSQLMFFKGTLEKMNIEMQVFRHGKFKSAIEPLMLDKMSSANRLQIETYMGSIWNSMLEGISKQRNVSVEELNKLANNLTINSPESAVENKLVDELKYEDEVMDLMRKDLKLGQKDKIAFANINK